MPASDEECWKVINRMEANSKASFERKKMKMTEEQGENTYLAMKGSIDRADDFIRQYYHMLQFISKQKLMPKFSKYLFTKMYEERD